MVGDVNARDSEREMRAVSDKLRRVKCMKALFPVLFFFPSLPNGASQHGSCNNAPLFFLFFFFLSFH